jgi:hypothetical protein
LISGNNIIVTGTLESYLVALRVPVCGIDVRPTHGKTSNVSVVGNTIKNTGTVGSYGINVGILFSGPRMVRKDVRKRESNGAKQTTLGHNATPRPLQEGLFLCQKREEMQKCAVGRRGLRMIRAFISLCGVDSFRARSALRQKPGGL